MTDLEDFVEEHTPFDDWQEFLEARRQYQTGEEDEAS